MNVKDIFHRPEYLRPEYLLATKITLSVLVALLAVITVTASFWWIADEHRVEGFFERRLENLLNRTGEFSRSVRSENRPEFESRLQERRFVPQSLRNFAVVYPDWTVSLEGSLSSDGVDVREFRNLPIGRAEERELNGEEYVFYAVRLNAERLLVLYEPEDLMVWPRNVILASVLLGAFAFSVALFFISLSFARKVIRPIEELAERERAYARHIAHELKTPLAVAKSDIQLALAVKEWSDDHLKSAISEIGMMRDTVDDLLLFSASGALAKTDSTDLRAMLHASIVRADASERFTVASSSDAPATVPWDAKILSTLFRNLVSNSLVHAPSDSKITVLFTADGFEFSNDAPDADPKVIKNAFDAFVWTPGKGSGIGLSLVRRIAEAHGWRSSMKLDNGRVTVKIDFAS